MYYKLRKDAIESVRTAPSVYETLYYLNLGRVRNTGTELQLDVSVIETPAFRWNVKGWFTANQNKLLSTNASARPFLVNSKFRTGYPLDAVWARPMAGYVDADGDGRLLRGDVTLADSVVYAGHSEPSYLLPFETSVALWHGQLSIRTGFAYQNGATIFNSGARSQLQNAYWNPRASLGVQAAAIAIAQCGGADDQSLSTCSYASVKQTVSTLRFNTFSVNYTVPQSISAKLRLPNLGLALQGSNLGLWSNYRGKDPNVNANSVGESVIDGGQIPEPRTWSIRVHLGN